MAFENGMTYAGTVVAVSAALPATYDEAGFAVPTFTTVGEVTSIGALQRVFTDVTYDTLAERGTVHLKGNFDWGETPLEVVIPRGDADAGQAILEAAEASDDPISFKFTLPDGTVKYCIGLVYSFGEMGGGPNDVRMANVSMRINRLGIVKVAAPS